MKSIFTKILYLFQLFLPWSLRRLLLQRVFGYHLHPESRIGLSWITPQNMDMGAGTRIGHFTVCKAIELLSMGEHSRIGNGNWITGFPKGGKHFTHQEDRHPALYVEEHAAITHRHIIDCTNTVRIGKYTTFAGYNSQILTHSIDLEECRQSSAPVVVGSFCFVGTNSVLLGGSVLPSFSVLGAKSLLNKSFDETHTLYGGVPAKPIQSLDPEMAYFQRTMGFVD